MPHHHFLPSMFCQLEFLIKSNQAEIKFDQVSQDISYLKDINIKSVSKKPACKLRLELLKDVNIK